MKRITKGSKGPLEGKMGENTTAFSPPPPVKHTAVIHHLRAAGHRVHEIECEGGGRAAVCGLGGRVASLRFPGLDENIFWSSPELSNHALLRQNIWGLTGGPGGERLWFAPEYVYHWTGKPDLIHYSNYKLPPATDPGSYEWTARARSHVSLKAQPALRSHRDRTSVSFEVQRSVSSSPCPIQTRGVRYVGIQIQHLMRMRRAGNGLRVGMWHLIQMPVGSRMLIPTLCKPRPLVYFNALGRNGWRCESNALTWEFKGNAFSKIGLDTSQVTGRAGVLRQMGNREWAAMIWQFPVIPGAKYCDGLDAKTGRQQVSQAWDGFGFGELEYHSPSVGMEDPVCAESSLIWCFGGSFKSVNEIAEKLMGRRWSR